MANDINNLRVAILVAEGFEQQELTEPRKALDEAGAVTQIVSPAEGEVQGWNHFDKADMFPVDVPLAEANADDFDALLLPGASRTRTSCGWTRRRSDSSAASSTRASPSP